MEVVFGMLLFWIVLELLPLAWEALKIALVLVVVVALVRSCDDPGASRIGPDGRYVERSYR